MVVLPVEVAAHGKNVAVPFACVRIIDRLAELVVVDSSVPYLGEESALACSHLYTDPGKRIKLTLINTLELYARCTLG